MKSLITIPIFTCTEDAISFGMSMTEDMIEVCQKAHQHYRKVSRSLLQQKSFNTAMVIATKGQFYREALEIYAKQ